MVTRAVDDEAGTLDDLLIELHRSDVILTVDGGKLRSNAPKGAITPKLGARIAAHRDSLIELLRRVQPDSQQAIRPTARDGRMPLSFAQKRMWFLDQIGSAAAYNGTFAFKIQGPLDAGALEKALQEILRRHESLRTTFAVHDGEPYQVIHDGMRLDFGTVDLSMRRGEELAAEVERSCQAERMRPFDLSSDPMLRATLLVLRPPSREAPGGANDARDAEHVLAMSMHHIASDMWSWGILVKELTALYSAFCRDSPSPLPEPRIQYADFSVWQKNYLQGEVLDRQLRYWKQQLAGAPELLPLLSDRARPAQQTFHGDVVVSLFDARLTRQLRTFSNEQGVTLYITLLSAFQIFMARYTGQADILVGSVIANRNYPDTEPLIGFFVNTLALRLNLSAPDGTGRLEPASYLEVLAKVNETVHAAYEFQDAPFERVVEEVAAVRSANHNPLVQVSFVLQNAPMDAFELRGLKVTPIALPEQTTRFDLEVHVWEVGDHLEVRYVYSTDLFDRPTIERLAGHFGTMVNALMDNPTGSITRSPMMTEGERHQILTEWNRTSTPYPRERCIHELFEEQAERTPDAIALRFEDRRLTYRELSRQSNELARRLQRLGVGAEALVGVCVERSLDLVVGLLGILKAGGVYVPLDPGTPAERLAFVAEDTAISILLTQRSLRPMFAKIPAVLCLDELDGESQPGQQGPAAAVRASNLAYVMYTSGSTGRPKGVSVTHRNVVRLVKETNFIRFSPDDVFLQLAPVSFDAATLEIWGPLLNGGQLAIMPPHNPSLRELGQALEKYRVTSLWLTSGLFEVMVDEQLAALSSLRWLVTGGDVASVSHFVRALDALPGCQIVNGYGPTENTTFTSCHLLKSLTLNDRTVPIGQPIGNTQVYVLDQELQPVPVGVVGELYAGGDGVARGYHNNQELTAKRFLPDHFRSPQDPGQPPPQLYSTGDFARWLPGGILEFMGRRDDQVKIRGFRIELSEIEASLRRLPDVLEAVVVVRATKQVRADGSPHSTTSADKRLVAYVVAAGAVDAAAVRDRLRRQLPDYMIPSAFVQLAAMPLTANGKIDRRALPGPDQASGAGFQAPSTPVERTLAEIWCDVLGVNEVGVHDNFFELGGHSLRATQVIARVRRLFSVDLALRTLFTHPTIAAHARVLADHRRQQADRTLAQSFPAIHHDPEHRHEPFPLTDVQHAYWVGRSGVFELGNVSAHVYFEIDSEGMDVERLDRAWQGLIGRHEMLRAIIQSDGRQCILPAVPVYRFAVTDLTGLDGVAVCEVLAAVRHEMSHQVLPPDRWPLFDIRVTRLSRTATRFHISLDGLILDGGSIGILLTEWVALYRNPLALLPPLEVSFRDYVLAEKAFQKSAFYGQSWKYWERRLDTLPPAPELPAARDARTSGQTRFQTHRFQLDAVRWGQLKSHGHRAGLTDSTIILSAFAEILTRWSKHAHFTLNLTLFNRLPLHPQINEVVGDFTPLLLLEVDNRTKQAHGRSFQGRGQRIQQQLWDDLDHRHVNGVHVLRELTKHQGRGAGKILMPVVFTSMLATSYDNQLFAPIGEMTHLSTQTPQVWLDHGVAESAGALDLSWSVVEGLFPDGMIESMLAAYEGLLARLATDESAWLDDQPVPLPQDQASQRAVVNSTAAPISAELLHTLFARQVPAHAADPAVITSGKVLTYQELYIRANQVGHWLRGHGAEPNTLVAVIMEKGWEQVVAVMGILMSGAAYLPIDSTLPGERRNYLLTQGEVKLVLTQTGTDAGLMLHAGIARLAVDTLPADSRLPLLDVVQTPLDLAYVIYTSGSTGLPKGVAIDHRGAVNTILDVNRRYGITSADRVLALSALNFDLSVYDIFGLLAVGGAVVLPEAGQRIEPGHWLESIGHHAVTVWNAVPALMQMLVDHSAGTHPVACGALRIVMLSGDWIPVTLPGRVRALWPQAALYSLGGATEASIWSIDYPIHAVDPDWRSIPYGKPMANQTIDVLDDYLNPCPVWAPGEIYIAGIGLAQGYWKDEARTNLTFITHPRTGARLYKTGDLGRYLPDGNVEFLGRDDFQIKIRGHRIELGEIENALLQHPSLDQAVVCPVGKATAISELVAYVVRNANANSGWRGELKAHLAAHLPAYMIPDLYVELRALPLTANGKVNRKELPALGRADRGLNFVAPANALEAQICAVLCKILRVDEVSTMQNFGELGIDSVHMVQVANQLRHALGCQIPLVALFQHSSAQALAAYLARANAPEPDGWAGHGHVPQSRTAELGRAQARLVAAQEAIPGRTACEPDAPNNVSTP